MIEKNHIELLRLRYKVEQDTQRLAGNAERLREIDGALEALNRLRLPIYR